MSNNKYKEQIRSFDERANEIENKELWESFQIDFLRVAREFPDNKVFGIIRIKPESARELIKNFILIVNDYNRGEFKSNYHTISISGFDIKKDKKVNVKIQAIPTDDNWETIKKESKSCDFFFTGQIASLSPIVNFEWLDDDSNPNIIVKWHHIDDRFAEKYALCLDKKEIHYINQRSLSDELQACIHYLESGEEHTVQIIAKLNNGKEKYRSDLIHFTVPDENDEQNIEVLNVYNERVSAKLLAIIDIEKEENVVLIDSNRYKQNVLELLEQLRDQIEKRKF